MENQNEENLNQNQNNQNNEQSFLGEASFSKEGSVGSSPTGGAKMLIVQGNIS